jgi:hypothetical protein
MYIVYISSFFSKIIGIQWIPLNTKWARPCPQTGVRALRRTTGGHLLRMDDKVGSSCYLKRVRAAAEVASCCCLECTSSRRTTGRGSNWEGDRAMMELSPPGRASSATRGGGAPCSPDGLDLRRRRWGVADSTRTRNLRWRRSRGAASPVRWGKAPTGDHHYHLVHLLCSVEFLYARVWGATTAREWARTSGGHGGFGVCGFWIFRN